MQIQMKTIQINRLDRDSVMMKAPKNQRKHMEMLNNRKAISLQRRKKKKVMKKKRNNNLRILRKMKAMLKLRKKRKK